jgi:predicted nucleic acid-binding protein
MEKLVQKVVGNSYKIMQRFEKFVMSCKRMTKRDGGVCKYRKKFFIGEFSVAPARGGWKSMTANGCILWTSDYVRLECCSLIQRRLGAAALRDFHDAILVLARVIIVGEEGFERAFEKWRLVQSRKWSLVDIISFDCMRPRGITQAYTFDSHFAQQGVITCLSEEG